MRLFRSSWLVAALSSFFTVSNAQTCETVTLQPTVPTNANVSLESYSYCGGTLNVTAWIANLCYNKLVTLYFANANGESTPLTALSLGFSAEVYPDNYTWEYWTASAPVYLDGITHFLNLTFDAVDVSRTYVQDLGNVTVTASGAPPPSSTTPVPYATPKGYAQDITDWLAATNGSEAGISKSKMFANINIPGAAPGTVIAAQSYTAPDYAYNWVRDSSLTMDVVESFYANGNGSKKATYEQILFQYAAARAQEQNDPNLQTGLGEPKFYLNNTIFTGPWGRPQNDGPATSAITLMGFANAYLAGGGSLDTVKQKIYDSDAYPIAAPVKKDLLFVASNWTSSSFDLWEEESSDHFYTRLVQRRALLMGASFAAAMSDSATSSTLSSAAAALSATLPEFWDPQRDLILYEYGPVLRGKASYKDIAVVLGVIHGYNGDGVYSYTNDEVLASAYQIATSFLPIYGIANVTKDASGAVLGIPIGRYPEDVYDGVGTSLGNPWYLATASMAELFYRAVHEYSTSSSSITVTNASIPFWSYFSPITKGSTNGGLPIYVAGQTFAPSSTQYSSMIQSLEGWADAFMRRVKYHTPADGSLTEEYNRNTGVPTGAMDLTWSYASVLTAAMARAEARGDSEYLNALANL